MSNTKRPTFYLRLFGDGYGHGDIRGLFSSKAAASRNLDPGEYVEAIELDEECPVYAPLSAGLKVLGLPDVAKMHLLRLTDEWRPMSAGYGESLREVAERVARAVSGQGMLRGPAEGVINIIEAELEKSDG